MQRRIHNAILPDDPRLDDMSAIGVPAKTLPGSGDGTRTTDAIADLSALHVSGRYPLVAARRGVRVRQTRREGAAAGHLPAARPIHAA